MALIDAERDDDALLRAEDEAIRLAANPTLTVTIGTTIAPAGSDTARLLEILNDGTRPKDSDHQGG